MPNIWSSPSLLPSQLTAVSSIRTLVDDWNFNDEQFIPFVRPCVEHLMSYVVESEELETQTHVRGGHWRESEELETQTRVRAGTGSGVGRSRGGAGRSGRTLRLS